MWITYLVQYCPLVRSLYLRLIKYFFIFSKQIQLLRFQAKHFSRFLLFFTTRSPFSLLWYEINSRMKRNVTLCDCVYKPCVHKETENEDQAQDQIDKFP